MGPAWKLQVNANFILGKFSMNKDTVKKDADDAIFTKMDEVHSEQMFYVVDSNIEALLSEQYIN